MSTFSDFEVFQRLNLCRKFFNENPGIKEKFNAWGKEKIENFFPTDDLDAFMERASVEGMRREEGRKKSKKQQLMAYVKRELDLLEKEAAPIQQETVKTLNNKIFELVDVCNEGTVYDIEYAMSILFQLAYHMPLSSLTGEENEWMVGPDPGSEVLQNIRCSKVFKNRDGKAFCIDVYIFSSDGGKTWFSANEGSVDITFPFTVPMYSIKICLKSPDEDRLEAIKRHKSGIK